MENEAEIRAKSSYVVLAVLCFGVLGALTGRRVGPEPQLLAGFALGGIVFAWLGLAILGRVLYVFNSQVRKRYGYAAVSNAMGNGFLMLLPFTVLAAVAELYLGWNAVQAFSAAGIMTGAASAGMELGKLGGGRLADAMLAAVGASGKRVERSHRSEPQSGAPEESSRRALRIQDGHRVGRVRIRNRIGQD